MINFYWYPKCSTCRKAKSTLEKIGVEYTSVDLKETPPTAEQFKNWFAQNDFEIKNYFNTSGISYRESGLKDRINDLTIEEASQLLASDGMLVKRPLLVKDDKVLQIGFKHNYTKTMFD